MPEQNARHDSSAYSAVFSRLSQVRRARREDTWIARCPVHDDHRPSMSLWIGQKGELVARCWSCHATFEAIAKAIGLPMGAWFPDNGQWKPTPRRIVGVFDFVDEHGEVLYSEVRYEPKDIKQRRPDHNGGWVWNLDGVRRILYRLPELLEVDPKRMVLIPEGPRKAERLHSMDFVATSNAGGSGKWLPEFSQALAGRHVCLLPDNDAAGRKHAEVVAGSLLMHNVASLRIVQVPVEKEKGDVLDWLSAGGTAAELKRLIGRADAWTRAPRKQPAPRQPAMLPGSFTNKRE